MRSEDKVAVLDSSPEHAAALAARATLKRKRGDTAGGEADARSALQLDEANLAAALFLASAQTERKEFDAAAQTLRRLI